MSGVSFLFHSLSTIRISSDRPHDYCHHHDNKIDNRESRGTRRNYLQHLSTSLPRSIPRTNTPKQPSLRRNLPLQIPHRNLLLQPLHHHHKPLPTTTTTSRRHLRSQRFRNPLLRLPSDSKRLRNSSLALRAPQQRLRLPIPRSLIARKRTTTHHKHRPPPHRLQILHHLLSPLPPRRMPLQ